MEKKIDSYNKNLEQNKEAPASWCVLPWSHISIKTNGTYRLCCHSETSQNRGLLRDKKNQPFHIGSADWADVINSPTMKAVRKTMLKGKWPEECIRCQREHDSGMISRNIYERQRLAGMETEIYPSYIKTKNLTRPDGEIPLEDFPVSFLDIRFGNLCNLKCIMCSPTDSSQWYEDHHSLWGKDHFYNGGKKIKLTADKNGKLKTEKNVFNWSDNKNLWRQIEKHKKQFRKIYIAGGEPLMIKRHYDFLQECVDQKLAGQIELEYNSNITLIPQKVWGIWRHFKRIIMGMSIDGFGKVNDLIRYPSQWSRIENNLLKFDQINGNFEPHIATTVSLLNIWHLPEFLEYIMQNNYKKIGPWAMSPLISPHPAHRPKYLNINILEEGFKERIKERFNFYKNKFSKKNWQSFYGDSQGCASWDEKVKSAHQMLDNYIKYMYKISYRKDELTQARSDFIYSMDKLDELRKTQWPKVFPELYESTLKWRKPS